MLGNLKGCKCNSRRCVSLKPELLVQLSSVECSFCDVFMVKGQPVYLEDNVRTGWEILRGQPEGLQGS